MSIVFHPADERGRFQNLWLNTRYSFSFSNWYNPEKMGFLDLRVLNDDIIAANSGFPTHSHENMEIVTLVLKGKLQHQDSTGSQGVIGENEIQIMSAGTGISHSEFNPFDEEVRLFQLWVMPEKYNITPRYDQKKFDPEMMQNQFCTVVSPEQNNEQSLWINQKSYFKLGKFTAGSVAKLKLSGKCDSVFLFVIEGGIEFKDQKLNQRDALAINNEGQVLDVSIEQDSFLLAIEMNSQK